MLKNSTFQYGAIAITLHWTSALLVVGLFASGLWIDTLSYYSKWYNFAPYYHINIGLILSIIIFFRLIWRWKNINPKTDASLNTFEIKASHIAHTLIYILIISIIITGYLIPTANNQGIDFFNLFTLPSLGSFIDNQADLAGLVHEYTAYTLIAIVSLHITAALKHHFVNKNNTLRKILPFTNLNNHKE